MSDFLAMFWTGLPYAVAIIGSVVFVVWAWVSWLVLCAKRRLPMLVSLMPIIVLLVVFVAAGIGSEMR